MPAKRAQTEPRRPESPIPFGSVSLAEVSETSFIEHIHGG
jgi:hypothetical protein